VPFVAIRQLATNVGLNIERQPFFGPAGGVVERAAHCPQKVLGATKAAKLCGSENAKANEPLNVANIMNVFGYPKQRVEITQPAFAVLHVWFDEIARIAKTFVTLVSL
jgi:hypothetical protein